MTYPPYKYHDTDTLYGWYEAGVDFLITRWNYICAHWDCDLGELPRILSRLAQAKKEAWDTMVGNPQVRAAEPLRKEK